MRPCPTPPTARTVRPRRVSTRADAARQAGAAELSAMGTDLVHALLALVLLVGILVLNVYKLRGLTRHGWRVERARQVRPSSVET